MSEVREARREKLKQHLLLSPPPPYYYGNVAYLVLDNLSVPDWREVRSSYGVSINYGQMYFECDIGAHTREGLSVKQFTELVTQKVTSLANALEISIDEFKVSFDQNDYDSEVCLSARLSTKLLSENFGSIFDNQEVSMILAEKEIQQEKQKVKTMLSAEDLELFKKLLNESATQEETLSIIYKPIHIQTMLSFATKTGFDRASPPFKMTFEQYKELMKSL